ncbi:MAG: beta-propeller fold lactonase family protein [Ignavibacteriae bacterium]|nr:beta-propeller fold lactonase family protein [Ignavibacteriota bacterium]
MKYSLSVILIVLLVGCKQNNEVITTISPPSGEFSAGVKPIFDQHCGTSDCHGGGPRGFAGGLDLTSYEGIMRGSRYGTVVVPGNVFMSHLIQTINWTDTTLSPLSSVTMPASRDPLVQKDIETIVRWVRNGARNDRGEIPFPEPRPAGKVFFSSQSVDLVGIIDVHTGLIMRYVGVGNALPFTQPPQAPHNVQIDDQGKYYYVTMITTGRLKKYDASTNELLGEVSAGVNPAHAVLTADGSKAYVTNFNNSVGQVYKISTSTMTVDRVIVVPGLLMLGTHGARLSHDGKYLYVGANSSDNVSIFDTSNDSLVAQVRVVNDGRLVSSDYRPYQIAVRSDDRFIYVTLNGNSPAIGGQGFVSVLERTGNSFALIDTITVGRLPLQCEVTPDQRFLYVCNQGSGSVTVIDAQTNTYSRTIENVGTQPHGIDINHDSRTVYVTLENRIQSGEPPHHPLVGSTMPGFLAVIDVGTQQVVKRIEVGGFAAGVSVYPGKGN